MTDDVLVEAPRRGRPPKSDNDTQAEPQGEVVIPVADPSDFKRVLMVRKYPNGAFLQEWKLKSQSERFQDEGWTFV